MNLTNEQKLKVVQWLADHHITECPACKTKFQQNEEWYKTKLVNEMQSYTTSAIIQDVSKSMLFLSCNFCNHVMLFSGQSINAFIPLP
jgi:hypothetical protein